MAQTIIDYLLCSHDPSIRYKTRVYLLDEDPYSQEIIALQDQIRQSHRAQGLLAGRVPDGRIALYPYAKWDGAHWVLAALADLNYPAGDESLLPLRDQVYAWLNSSNHLKSVRIIDGRARRCASQEGYALYATLALGLADERALELAGRLIFWQWPDGGWNCDKKPAAVHSSFMETLLPMRALWLYGRLTSDSKALAAAQRAAEIFLKRRLFRRQSNGEIIHGSFVRLHYPRYWHYDILYGLMTLAEMGHINDERCQEALDLLESKRLPDGGFPAEEKFYRVSPTGPSGRSPVDWGGASRRKMNEFVTVDALYVLKAAGRKLIP
ncbi:MAG TPA: hypothetical protein VLH85_08275 [Levilinea sp.]|nr:hypothetical protein [Levilinea sp.]